MEKLGLAIDVDQIEEKCVKRIKLDEEIQEDEEGYTVGTISSISVDSDGDVVLPTAIDFSRYKMNPVVLLNHNLNQPIGYAEKISVHDDKIVAKTKYGNTPEAQKVYQLIKDKVLRTHSIGFITLEQVKRTDPHFKTITDKLQKEYPNKFTDDKVKTLDRIVTKALLIEYSIVTIPANEEAVMTEVKSVKNNEELEVKEEPKVEVKEEPKVEELEVKEVKEVKEEPKIEIKVVKRGSKVKKVSTLKEREAKKLKDLYLKLWGV